jgi:hypothetical protein
VQDVANQYVVITEPNLFALHGSLPRLFYNVLAHELGHCLLLSHGDGLLNGGTLPPNNGPRKFDQDCGGFSPPISLSLMYPGGASDVITPLQRELARDAAVLVPGHTGSF